MSAPELAAEDARFAGPGFAGPGFAGTEFAGTEFGEPVAEPADADGDAGTGTGAGTGQSGGIGRLSGDHVVAVTDPRGSVSVGDRIAFYLQAGLRGVDQDSGPVRTPRLVAQDVLADLRARFVAPPGYGQLVRRLRDPGTVVVCGPAGSGRRTAALMALAGSGAGATRFRELPDDDTEEFHLDESLVEPGERLLLDLSAESGPLPRRLLTSLRAYRAVVADRAAYLAVVLPAQPRYLDDELVMSALDIARPDGRLVFERHLRVLGVPVRAADLDHDPLAARLDHDPVWQLAALAEHVRRARAAADGTGTWADWLAVALRPDAQRDAAATFVRDHPDGRVRALLLAVAVFEHADPATVSTAAATLLDVVDYPPVEEHRLDRPDFADALHTVGATLDEGVVRFATATYGAAVRDHFWSTFPDLRDALGRWLDRCVGRPGLADEDRVAAVLRYTDQCLRTGQPEDLCRLVEDWARRSPYTVGFLLDAAGPALARGLLDERHGQWFRRRVYRWALNRRLWPSLASLLVGLCTGVLAPSHPHQALVRLRHFTRHEHRETVRQARTALVGLAEDGPFARQLLTRVRADLVGDRPRPVDYALFHAVADPVRLVAATGTQPSAGERHVRELLVDGWAAALATEPYDQVAVAVRRWLDTHAAEPDRTVLLDILTAATDGRPRRQAVLYAVARDWVAQATEPPERHDRQRTAALLRRASQPKNGANS